MPAIGGSHGVSGTPGAAWSPFPRNSAAESPAQFTADWLRGGSCGALGGQAGNAKVVVLQQRKELIRMEGAKALRGPPRWRGRAGVTLGMGHACPQASAPASSRGAGPR